MKILSKDNLVSAFSFVLRKVEGLADDIYAELNKTKKAIVSEVKYYTVGVSPYAPPSDPSIDDVENKSITEYAVVDGSAIDIIGWGTEQLIPEKGEYLWCAVLETYVDGSQGWQEPICLTDDYVREVLESVYTKTEVDDSLSKLNKQISTEIQSAQTVALNAQSIANETLEEVSEIKTGIEDIQLSVNNVRESAALAQSAADAAKNTAESAIDAANTAQASAENAQSVAQAAQGSADNAQSIADSAKEIAESATEAAGVAQTSADNAQSAASAAQSTADNAQSTADKAQSDIDDLKSNLGTLIQAYLDDNPYYAIVG